MAYDDSVASPTADHGATTSAPTPAEAWVAGAEAFRELVLDEVSPKNPYDDYDQIEGYNAWGDAIDEVDEAVAALTVPPMPDGVSTSLSRRMEDAIAERDAERDARLKAERDLADLRKRLKDALAAACGERVTFRTRIGYDANGNELHVDATVPKDVVRGLVDRIRKGIEPG